MRLHPANVTEGQRVTLTCIPSCPLAENTTYTWYLNNQAVKLQQNKNKQLVLDPVSSQHAGNYHCAVKNVKSNKKTLTVQSNKTSAVAAAAAGGAVVTLLIITLIITLIFVILWIRR